MFLYPIKISKETFKFYIMEITKENIKYSIDKEYIQPVIIYKDFFNSKFI